MGRLSDGHDVEISTDDAAANINEPVPVAARSLRRRSADTLLLRSWVRIPPGEWMDVCCEYCVLSGRGLCDELINRPEESYRL